KDTNTTKFGQIGDSVYYVDGFGDSTKVFVNNDTVITTLVDNGNGIFTYTNEAGATTTFDTKDTVVTTLTDNGDSTFTYRNELGATTTLSVKLGNINNVEHLRDDTLSVTQGSNIYKVDLANTMAEIYDVTGGHALTTSFAVIPFGTDGVIDNNYTSSTNSITISKSGRYRITYRVSTEMVDGNNRSESEYQLTRNNTVVPGTYASGYHRNNINGTSTSSVVKVVNLNAGDVIRVVGRKSEGIGDLETKANGSSLLIERL
ncbi:MAG: hypothetical protein ABF238_03000, partial [Flavobacteriales bacterium]